MADKAARQSVSIRPLLRSRADGALSRGTVVAQVLVYAMSKMLTAMTTFTPGERDYIRRELDMLFSTYPTVAEGFQLKTWRGGPHAGQPRLPPPARSLLDRGLMRLDTGSRLPRLFFTDAGLVELRAMMADRRLADPVKFAHIRRELGIDPV